MIAWSDPPFRIPLWGTVISVLLFLFRCLSLSLLWFINNNNMIMSITCVYLWWYHYYRHHYIIFRLEQPPHPQPSLQALLVYFDADIHISASSLSLRVYIYIYIYTHTHIHTHIVYSATIFATSCLFLSLVVGWNTHPQPSLQALCCLDSMLKCIDATEGSWRRSRIVVSTLELHNQMFDNT